ncbi:FAD-dependent monooxygenase [Promicromonospora iranensis]|uniref:2-polyprenyl-6-methoxyphenol hydroxylase-like FAD-dependent oxidoreductase n=1 Tax=Promicromonospora iranensis TaxID=1105144 RepID=A0ABU2CMW8_9MICO|nr:FAD-dependent monooxygenase [Promicromonospora iranensis]MDR7382621.1 2-polyprenyl-6-methoxyphenol hydroxylase-like FAD-dependent oxidoreductase [Promicromonospora iranensis]
MRALISGAGIAGLALANRLHHHGWEVHVVERAPGPRTQGYMIDFFGPGFEAITAMGLEPRLRELASPVEEFSYIDDRGRTTVSVDYTLFAKAVDGGMVSIMRPALEQLLRESTAGAVDLRYGTTVDRVTDGVVELSDATTLDVDLVVGADGVHSGIRSQIFGPDRGDVRYLGMQTGAFVFTDPTVFDQVRGRFVLTETLNRQMGFYGLDDGRVAVFTVFRTEDPALPEDPRAALRRTFAGMGDLAERALAHCPPSDEIYYDQVAQIDTPRWTDGHVALVGDAAYAVSLVAGQGASLGIAGAYVLAERLQAAPSVPEGLADYERRWRPVATGVQEAARDRVTEWFVPTRMVTLLLRRWGFRAMKLPGLDRILVGPLLPKRHRSVAELSA